MINQELPDNPGFKFMQSSVCNLMYDLAAIAEERSETITGALTFDAQTSSDPSSYTQSLRDVLHDRAETLLRKSAFRLAVVGEFKVGKSTMVNALIQNEVVPIGRRPTTATVAKIRYGEPERFRVTYLPQFRAQNPTFTQETTDLLESLKPYISDPAVDNEEQTGLISGEIKSLSEKIQEVEIWCKSEFLRDREIELIDTPGLGSSFPEHRTVTYSIVPEVDATIFLFSTEDGIGQSELEFLSYVREYVHRVFFVMSKSDYASGEQDIIDQSNYNKKVLEKKAQLFIDNIYPVSARALMEGNLDNSGFEPMIEALDQFILRAGGVARLEAPIHFVHYTLDRITMAIDNDMHLANQKLQNVRDERNRLESEASRIEARKRELMRYVSDTVADMVLDATDGIDHLPAQIQIQIEKQIDTFGIKHLMRADRILPEKIKEVAQEWLTSREKRFSSKARRLEQRIVDDLHDILETIERRSSTYQQTDIEMESISVKGIRRRSIAKFVGGAMMRGAVHTAAGYGLVGFALGVLGITVFTPAMVLVPLLFPLRSVVVDTLQFQKRVRTIVKDGLSKPIRGTNVNAYTAVVEGYFDPEMHVSKPGLRYSLTTSLNEWGTKLKQDISNLVDDTFNRAMQRIQQRIELEENGRWSHENEIAKLKDQKATVDALHRRLIEIETMVDSLTQDRNDD